MPILTIRNGKISSVTNEKQLTGEKIPGDLATWARYSTDPNIILKYGYGLLSERSASLYHTHPPVAAAVEKQTTYAVGPGLVFRSQPDWKTLGMTKEKAKEWGMQFQKLVHYAFMMLNFYEKQATIFRTGMIQGDSLLLFDRADPAEGLPFDVIETGGDQIDWERDEESPRIILGIKVDRYLRRQGICLKNQKSAIPFKDENGNQNLVQFFEKKISRQLRGYPLAYRIIASAKNNDRYWDAILNRAALEATILGVEKSDSGDMREQAMKLAEWARNMPDQDANVRTAGSNPAAFVQSGNIANSRGGEIYSMETGGDFSFLEMKTPSNNFDKLQTAYVELVGMGMDMPPEVLMSKYSTSFTAHKGALNDFVKSYMKKRQSLVRSTCNPLVRELAKYFISEGLLPMPHDNFFNSPIIQLAALQGNWLGPVPGHINPLQEVNAKAQEVEQGFRTRADAAADYGNEWDNQIEEWLEQEEQWRKASPEQKAEVLGNQMQEEDEQEEDEDNQHVRDQEDEE